MAPGVDDGTRAAALRDRLVPPMPGSRLWGWLGPLLVTALGTFVRFSRLSVPHAVIFDETYYVADAWGILRFGVEHNYIASRNTLIARGVVRGINRDYIGGLYAMALRPHLTFWLNVRPETAFAREFKKAQAISYWEAGRDMSLSHDLYWSFIRYQTMIKREFEVMAKRHNFIELDGEASVSAVNKQLRQRIGDQLGIRATKYTPSAALAHLWR